MWLSLAFLSALLLGFYDVAKKRALAGNAVLPVLWLNSVFGALLFSPMVVASVSGAGWFEGSILDIPAGTLHDHLLIVLKACIVLGSWMCGYFGLKHLPLTIVGPINATRPVMVLLGALLLFGERLNALQWGGVIVAMVSLYLLGRTSRREGVDFRNNKWIWCVGMAAVLGAASGLYDKYVMGRLDSVFVQSWFNLYQAVIMTVIAAVLWWPRRKRSPFHWSWAIPFITLFVSAADFAYFYALGLEDSLISVVSMIRRGSVLVSFAYGAIVLREHNLRGKAFDLLLILLGMVLLYLGSRA
ncbi:MAG: EamA family transporter [Rikenellaceae bacterium]|nr:EamA family transporter [Rikenellaceae bacterium]